MEEKNEPKLLKEIFNPKYLTDLFIEKLKMKRVVGIDGLHSDRFAAELDSHTKLISKKVNSGRYAFTNYAEILVLKGRDKSPRILSVPVVRDQLVLKALNAYLTSAFPNSFTPTAKNQLKKLTKFLNSILPNSSDYGILKVDVSGFYDNIDRDILMNKIRASITDPAALKLIYDSLSNTTVPRSSPKSTTKNYFRGKGVPQGIAISNILANIYLLEFDKILERNAGICLRYVDDILIIAKNSEIADINNQIKTKFDKLGLKFNHEKTEEGVLDCTPFDFLGYTFEVKKNGNNNRVLKVGVRNTSIEKLIKKIAATFSAAKDGKSKFKEAKRTLKKDEYRIYFIDKLNERITGSISPEDEESGKPLRNYGWLFYFDKINDLPLLFRLDRLVTKFCERCDLLNNERPTELKSFVKAYREIGRMRKENRTSSEYINTYQSRIGSKDQCASDSEEDDNQYDNYDNVPDPAMYAHNPDEDWPEDEDLSAYDEEKNKMIDELLEHHKQYKKAHS